MQNMKTPKHSYVFSKDFILCCLAEDDSFFYGEILYGKKRMENVKTIKLDKVFYYKYWELEHQNGVNRKKVGEKTSYTKYLNFTTRLYPEHYFNHSIIGNLFRISKRDVIKVIPPKNYYSLSKFQKQIINHLRIKFPLSLKNILVGGSNLINEKNNHNDFDLLIKGKTEGIKMSKFLNEITLNKTNQVLIGEGRYHQRRFHINNQIICPFSIYKTDNFFEIAKNRKLENKKEITAKVTDSSGSLFSPARYKIKTNKSENYLLISYFVGHAHLFKEGDIIKFKAPLFQFFKNSIKKKAFVIPIEGSWVDIN